MWILYMTWTHEDLYGRHILTNILTLLLSSTDVMERGTVKMVQMSHQHALIVTVVQGHISVLMVTVQHHPPSVMVWMTVEMVLMKRIVTYHVLTWNSSASPMAAVCWMRGSVMEMRTAKITVMKLQKYAVSFWITWTLEVDKIFSKTIITWSSLFLHSHATLNLLPNWFLSNFVW